MSQIIPTTRGGTCGVCHNKFFADEPELTHVGGENHDGYHKPCLISLTHAVCPLDRQPMAVHSLVSRTDRVMANLKPALTNGAYATSFALLSVALSGPSAAITAGFALAVAAINRVAPERLYRGDVAIPFIGLGTFMATQVIERDLFGIVAGFMLAKGFRLTLMYGGVNAAQARISEVGCI